MRGVHTTTFERPKKEKRTGEAYRISRKTQVGKVGERWEKGTIIDKAVIGEHICEKPYSTGAGMR